MTSLHGRHWRPTFKTWLYWHAQEPGERGNLIRALITDRCPAAKDVCQINGYVRHLAEAHGASSAELGALTALWLAYQEELRTRREVSA